MPYEVIVRNIDQDGSDQRDKERSIYTNLRNCRRLLKYEIAEFNHVFSLIDHALKYQRAYKIISENK